MVAGFDRYFQIAPCFRDEAGRADRSPGEHLSARFRDVVRHPGGCVRGDRAGAARGVRGVWRRPSGEPAALPAESPMPARCERYGSDKPDLRNPIVMSDVTSDFRGSGFRVFADLIDADPTNVRVWAIPAPAGGSRAFCDQMNSWAQSQGQPGLGYIMFRDGEGAGPIARNIGSTVTASLRGKLELNDGDAVFFVCGAPKSFAPFASDARLKIGRELGLTKEDTFEFCWITDFPMYELDEETARDRLQPQPVFDAARRSGCAGSVGPARDRRPSVRHRLQRGGARLRRDPQPSSRHNV